MERIFCFFFSPAKLFSAKLTQVHIIRGRCQPRILVFTRMQIRFLWFCRYVVLDMALVLPRERGQGMTLLYVTSS